VPKWRQSCNQIVVVTVTTAPPPAQLGRENKNLYFQVFKDPFHQHLQLWMTHLLHFAWLSKTRWLWEEGQNSMLTFSSKPWKLLLHTPVLSKLIHGVKDQIFLDRNWEIFSILMIQLNLGKKRPDHNKVMKPLKICARPNTSWQELGNFLNTYDSTQPGKKETWS
jgi:hypothetical protein